MHNGTAHLGSLTSFGSRNWFASDRNHEVHALRIKALESALSIIANWNALIDRAVAYGDNYPQLARFRGAETTPAFIAAATAQRLITAAREKMNAADVPTQPPPVSVSLDQWRLAWYIDLQQLERVLPQLNDAINRGQAAYVALANYVSQRAGRSQTVTPQELPTNFAIDKSPIGTQDLPESVRAAGSNLLDLIKSPIGLMAIVGIGIALVWRKS